MLIFAAFFMSNTVSKLVFERLPHLEDEIAYLYQSKVFARGYAVVDIPDPNVSFWQPFVLDDWDSGNRFGKYTPGWPLVLAVGANLGTEWVVNAWLAALTMALLIRFATELFNRDVGLIAGILYLFSPMALLLNGTLMGHTSALFFATLFMYSYWRFEHGNHPFRCTLIAGVSLGMVVITRPVTSIAIALPFVVWSGVRLFQYLRQSRGAFWGNLRPYVVLGLATLVISSAIPIFNYFATDDPTQNLYELQWEYDRFGFGECCGRNGHNIQKGLRHARFDLSLTAADALGWQIGAVDDELQGHLRTEANFFRNTGLSFILLPIGLVVGVVLLVPRSRRRRELTWLIGWLVVAVAWCLFPFTLDDATQQDRTFSWIWLLMAYAWLFVPLVFILHESKADEIRPRWTWILLCVVLGLVLFQSAYWIGSQRYSTRYYYEALSAFVILSALPIGWLVQRWEKAKVAVYIVLLMFSMYAFYTYTTPRIDTLFRFNKVGQDRLDMITERRTSDAPLLILGTGDSGSVRWRAMGTYMAVTSPFLDSDIVFGWDNGWEGAREKILEQFPDREVIEVSLFEEDVFFPELGAG